MRSYEATFTVVMHLSDHDDTMRDLRRLDPDELTDALDNELPITLWVTDDDGDDHGYDVKGSVVTLQTPVARSTGEA